MEKALDQGKNGSPFKVKGALDLSQPPPLQPRDVLKLISKTFVERYGHHLVRISGVILSEARPAKEYVYFDMGYDEGSIQARIPMKDIALIRKGFEVVIDGYVDANYHSTWNSGIRATIDGTIFDRRVYNLNPSLDVKRQLPKMSLKSFIDEHPSKLMILGSPRAIQDLKEEVSKHRVDPALKVKAIKISSKLDLVAALQAIDLGMKGIMLIRGGADSSHGMSLWDDKTLIQEVLSYRKHIYLGVGHADTHTGMDAFSDEVFATPTAAGRGLAEAYIDLQKRRDREHWEAVRENKVQEEKFKAELLGRQRILERHQRRIRLKKRMKITLWLAFFFGLAWLSTLG